MGSCNFGDGKTTGKFEFSLDKKVLESEFLKNRQECEEPRPYSRGQALSIPNDALTSQLIPSKSG